MLAHHDGLSAYVEVTRQTNEILPDRSSAKHTDPAKKRLGAGINIEDALCQPLTSIQFLDLPKPPANHILTPIFLSGWGWHFQARRL
jgi:hypothetical protein